MQYSSCTVWAASRSIEYSGVITCLCVFMQTMRSRCATEVVPGFFFAKATCLAPEAMFGCQDLPTFQQPLHELYVSVLQCPDADSSNTASVQQDFSLPSSRTLHTLSCTGYPNCVCLLDVSVGQCIQCTCAHSRPRAARTAPVCGFSSRSKDIWATRSAGRSSKGTRAVLSEVAAVCGAQEIGAVAVGA